MSITPTTVTIPPVSARRLGSLAEDDDREHHADQRVGRADRRDDGHRPQLQRPVVGHVGRRREDGVQRQRSGERRDRTDRVPGEHDDRGRHERRRTPGAMITVQRLPIRLPDDGAEEVGASPHPSAASRPSITRALEPRPGRRPRPRRGRRTTSGLASSDVRRSRRSWRARDPRDRRRHRTEVVLRLVQAAGRRVRLHVRARGLRAERRRHELRRRPPRRARRPAASCTHAPNRSSTHARRPGPRRRRSSPARAPSARRAPARRAAVSTAAAAAATASAPWTSMPNAAQLRLVRQLGRHRLDRDRPQRIVPSGLDRLRRRSDQGLLRPAHPVQLQDPAPVRLVQRPRAPAEDPASAGARFACGATVRRRAAAGALRVDERPDRARGRAMPLQERAARPTPGEGLRLGVVRRAGSSTPTRRPPRGPLEVHHRREDGVRPRASPRQTRWERVEGDQTDRRIARERREAHRRTCRSRRPPDRSRRAGCSATRTTGARGGARVRRAPRTPGGCSPAAPAASANSVHAPPDWKRARDPVGPELPVVREQDRGLEHRHGVVHQDDPVTLQPARRATRCSRRAPPCARRSRAGPPRSGPAARRSAPASRGSERVEAAPDPRHVAHRLRRRTVTTFVCGSSAAHGEEVAETEHRLVADAQDDPQADAAVRRHLVHRPRHGSRLRDHADRSGDGIGRRRSSRTAPRGRRSSRTPRRWDRAPAGDGGAPPRAAGPAARGPSSPASANPDETTITDRTPCARAVVDHPAPRGARGPRRRPGRRSEAGPRSTARRGRPRRCRTSD